MEFSAFGASTIAEERLLSLGGRGYAFGDGRRGLSAEGLERLGLGHLLDPSEICFFGSRLRVVCRFERVAFPDYAFEGS